MADSNGLPTFDNPAAWTGPALARSVAWIHVLTAAERAEIVEQGRHLEDGGAGRPWAVMGPLLREVREELRTGRGFALLRGFPVEDLSPQATRLAYQALGEQLGELMPQNRRGELIHDVRDTGADRRDPNVRLSTTNAEQDFHTDGADIIGLLCLKTARAGGVSRIVSSVSVYNRLAAERPDLVPLLFEPWYFHLKGEQQQGGEPWFRLPIAQRIGGGLSSFFIGWYIRDAEKLPGVPRLGPQQQEALAAYESAANSPDLYLDMDFEPGDVQWLKNSVILHKRTGYEDWPEPERKRHLLRLWLAAPDFEDGIVALRRGHAAARA